MANKNWQQISYNQSAGLTNPTEKNIEKDIFEIIDNYEWNFTLVTALDGAPNIILTVEDLAEGCENIQKIITNYIKENFQKS